MQSRRRFLQSAGVLSGMAATFPAWADEFVNLDLPGGPDRRELTTAFPQKAPMIVQRTRPPLLETPWDVYDHSVFTPNDRFFVRWHWAVIPERVGPMRRESRPTTICSSAAYRGGESFSPRRMSCGLSFVGGGSWKRVSSCQTP